MNRHWFKIFIFLLFIFTNEVSSSQSIAVAIQDDDLLIVTAKRSPLKTKNSYQQSHILKNDQRENSSLGEQLNTLPQVHFYQRGGVGQTGNAFIRGMDGHHTTVLVDDIPMNDPSDPNRGFNFNFLNSDFVSRIEVLKGPETQIHGSSAGGGVVALYTEDFNDDSTDASSSHNRLLQKVKFQSQYANSKMSSVGSSYSIKKSSEKISYSIKASGAYHDEKSALIDSPSTPSISAKERKTNEERDVSTEKTLHANLNLKNYGNHHLKLHGHYRENTTEYDSTFPLNPKSTDHSRGKTFALGFSDRYDLNDQSTLDVKGSHLAIRRKNFGTSVGTSEVYEGQNQILDFMMHHNFFPLWTYSLGGNLKNESIEINDQTSPLSKTSFHKGFSNELQKSSDSTDNFIVPWFFSMGFRFDDLGHTSQQGKSQNQSSYRSLLGFDLSEEEFIKFSFSKITNAPSLYSLYGIGGNPYLKSEVIHQGEINFETAFFEHAHAKYVLNLGYFQTSLQDKIQYDFQTSQMTNIGKVKIEGVEGSLTFKGPTETVLLSSEYTEAYDLTNNRRLPNRPKTLTKISYTKMHQEHFQYGMLFRSYGTQVDTTQTLREKIVLFDVFCKWSLPFGGSVDDAIHAKVSNALNEGYIIEKNYSEPGRTFSLSYEAQF